MKPDYDLICIGAGSGGIAAARRADLHGARVAVVEAGRVGGTCVIRGCVPKKLLMYAAQLGDALHDARGYGWAVPDVAFDMSVWATAKAAETTRLEGIYRQMLVKAEIALIEGWGRIDGPGRVQVKSEAGTQLLTARHIVIATGAAPVRDSIPGIADCATSDELLDLSSLPQRAAVIGAGYIALEFASMLARLGVEVSLFYRAALPLRGFDAMLRSAIVTELQSAGVRLHPEQSPTRVRKTAQGFELSFASGQAMSFPWVLNATGRRPNTQGLGLDSVGVTLDKGGAVPVDAALQTTVSGVHAIGDVTDRMNLTPVAIAEGRALADSLFGAAPRRVDLSQVASAVFTLPPMASVGPSEDEAQQSGLRVAVFETDFRPMKQVFTGGAERTRIKLLVDADSDRVLALHMIGADAPEIVQSLAVALRAGATKADFDRTLAVHPTAAEEFVLLGKPARVLEPQSETAPRIS